MPVFVPMRLLRTVLASEAEISTPCSPLPAIRLRAVGVATSMVLPVLAGPLMITPCPSFCTPAVPPTFVPMKLPSTTLSVLTARLKKPIVWPLFPEMSCFDVKAVRA